MGCAGGSFDFRGQGRCGRWTLLLLLLAAGCTRARERRRRPGGGGCFVGATGVAMGRGTQRLLRGRVADHAAAWASEIRYLSQLLSLNPHLLVFCGGVFVQYSNTRQIPLHQWEAQANQEACPSYATMHAIKAFYYGKDLNDWRKSYGGAHY